MGFLAQRINSVVIELADCLCQEIKKREMPEPCFCGVLPGDDAPFIYCNVCQGGQAWTRLVGVGTPSGDMELPLNNCVGMMAVQIEMGMVSGFLGIDDDGEPIGMGANFAAFERQIDEMDAMFTALTCCDLTIQEKVSGLSYTPVGPEGGCLGGIWTGTVPVI